MAKTSKKPLTADQIAEKATRGEDVSRYFTNKFAVGCPVCQEEANLLSTESPGRFIDLSAKRRP
jgi:hypothetical protein